jgi:predicted Zn-dependent protease
VDPAAGTQEVNRAAAIGSLAALFALGDAELRGATPAPAANDTNITIDPDIAKASAEADAAAGTSPSGTDAPATSQNPQTPYAKALLNYKAGKYEAAQALIDEADEEAPGNIPIELLKVNILAELKDFHGAHQVLNSLYDRSDLTPVYASALTLTNGDLNLHEHHFEAASKAYETSLLEQPKDEDTKLKLVYARLGLGDFVTAGKLASELKPAGATPAYYFAQAALARAGTGGGDEEQDMQQARTLYGITLMNRYLKTYLEVFGSEKSAGGSSTAPADNAAPPAPSGKAQ